MFLSDGNGFKTTTRWLGQKKKLLGRPCYGLKRDVCNFIHPSTSKVYRDYCYWHYMSIWGTPGQPHAEDRTVCSSLSTKASSVWVTPCHLVFISQVSIYEHIQSTNTGYCALVLALYKGLPTKGSALGRCSNDCALASPLLVLHRNNLPQICENSALLQLLCCNNTQHSKLGYWDAWSCDLRECIGIKWQWVVTGVEQEGRHVNKGIIGQKWGVDVWSGREIMNQTWNRPNVLFFNI